MGFAKTSLVSLVALSFIGNASADDVVVDLSVLNNLNSGSYVEAEPLFPVLPKVNHKKAVPLKKKKAVSKPIQAKKEVKIEEEKPIAIAPQPKVEEEKSVVAPRPEVEEEKIVVVDVEPQATAPEEQNVVIAETTVETAPLVAENQEVKAAQNTENETVAQAPVLPIQTETSINNDSESLVKENASADKTALLVNDNSEEKQPLAEEDVLIFEDHADELNAEQEQQIDTIITSFKNQRDNKIAIYSYNVDDGVDSFRKKRISLNRAISVRSYLLQKGFKNFSIKVVNVSADSNKKNCLKLQEI